jgi:uncharacterized protein (TIGR02996 family)
VTDATRALLAAVLDDPDDIASRRVYADALSSAGDPRGELIQVQCDLADCTAAEPQFAPLLVRERQLLTKHAKTWTKPFASFLYRPVFVRGFIAHALVNTKKFIRAASDLLGREPITSLHLRDLTQANASTLGAQPELPRLRSLKVTESRLSTRGAEALFSQPLPGLRSLDLYQSGIDDDGLAHIGKAVFPQLERLNLSGTRVTYTALEDLLHGPRLARLGYLGARWLFPGTDGSGFLAEHLDLPALTHLDLGSSHHSHHDLSYLARNSTFQRLRGLRLENNDLHGAGAIEALAPLTKLEVLDLSTNSVGIDGVASLAASELPLRVLRLYQCGIGDEHLVALAAGAFPNLKALDLGYGGVSARGIDAICRTAWPLEQLELWANKIGDDGVTALANASFTRTIRELVLGYNEIGDDGAAALAAGNWPKLERIVFRGDPIGEAGARALAGSTTMPALRSLKFENMRTPRSALGALRKRGVLLEM